jgi:membrane protease YdiL (CAAX protease family)
MSIEQGTAPAPVRVRPTISGSAELTVSRSQRVAGLLIVVGIAVVPLIMSSVFTLMVGDTNQSDTSVRYRYIIGITMEVISLALLAYVVRQNRGKWADFGLVFRLSDIPYGILLWVVALFSYSVASPSVLSYCEMLGWHRVAAYVPGFRLGGFLALSYVISSPIFEEMIVRAFVMTETLALTGSSGLAVLVSVLLQTSYHLYQGIPYALSAAVIFLVFSVYYARTRRIVAIMTAHFIWDLYAFLSHAAHQLPVRHS